jgi:hypothetical protein
MKKFLMLFAVAAFMAPAAGFGQASGEIVGSAALGQTGDIFQCGRGKSACNLQVRLFNEIDPTDQFGLGNPVDGYPAYRVKGLYEADPQLTGNYPSAAGLTDLNWYAIWDGVVQPNRFDHVGYYGAQSQVISFGELGNSTSANCLPVVSQTACFMALSLNNGNDLDAHGQSGSALRHGGLSPIPRPTVTFSDSSSIDLVWEEAAAFNVNDGAPNPIQGYKLYFAVMTASRRLGPSENELAAEESAGNLIDATPGTFLPKSTTSFTLNAGDPQLAGFDPATQHLVATIKLVYAHDVSSSYFSGNSYSVSFQQPQSRVEGLRGRLNKRSVVLDWRADSLAGIAGFSVMRAGQAGGPYHPIDREDIQVSGMQGSFVAVDQMDRRMPDRSSRSLYYRLEVTALDGSRTYTAPVAVNIQPLRRDTNGR